MRIFPIGLSFGKSIYSSTEYFSEFSKGSFSKYRMGEPISKVDLKKITLREKKDLLKKSLHVPQEFLEVRYSDKYYSDESLNIPTHVFDRTTNEEYLDTRKRLEYSTEGLNFDIEAEANVDSLVSLFQQYLIMFKRIIEKLDPECEIPQVRTSEIERYVSVRELLDVLR